MRGRPVAPTAFAVPLSQPSPAAVHLLCVPYAGGGAAVFRHWPALLPPTLAVSAIRLPGRESRIGEPPLADIGQMVTAAADDLAADTATGRPYALFGHSFGALVAFIEYTNRFFLPIRDLGAKYTVMQAAMASLERIFALLDARPAGRVRGAGMVDRRA